MLAQYARLYGIIYESPLQYVDFINYLHHTRRNIVIIISIALGRGVGLFLSLACSGLRMSAAAKIHKLGPEFVHEITHLLNFAKHTFKPNLWDNFTGSRKYLLFGGRIYTAALAHTHTSKEIERVILTLYSMDTRSYKIHFQLWAVSNIVVAVVVVY